MEKGKRIETAKDLLEFQIEKHSGQLSKLLLNYLEDKGLVDFSIRKRILDTINENKRDLVKELELYNINLKIRNEHG